MCDAGLRRQRRRLDSLLPHRHAGVQLTVCCHSSSEYHWGSRGARMVLMECSPFNKMNFLPKSVDATVVDVKGKNKNEFYMEDYFLSLISFYRWLVSIVSEQIVVFFLGIRFSVLCYCQKVECWNGCGKSVFPSPPVFPPGPQGMSDSRQRAVSYIEGRLSSLSSTYAAAMASYALANENKFDRDFLYRFVSPGVVSKLHVPIYTLIWCVWFLCEDEIYPVMGIMGFNNHLLYPLRVQWAIFHQPPTTAKLIH